MPNQPTPPSDFLTRYCGGEIQPCLQGIYNLFLGLALAVALLMVVVGAFQYLTYGAINRQQEGKRRITDALAGLVIIFLSGVALYWINPDIFNAQLIVYRVGYLDVPKFDFGVGYRGERASVPPEEGGGLVRDTPNVPAPKLELGQTLTFTNVRVTRYYVPKETERPKFRNSFEAEVRLQGTGRCLGNGVILQCQGYNGYITINWKNPSGPLVRTAAPRDNCEYIIVAKKTIAVPREWWPALVEIYVNNQLKVSGYGVDTGGAINDKHIDLYLGEGRDVYDNEEGYPYATVKIQKLSGCRDPALRNLPR